MGSPEMDWWWAICWALMDSKMAMRLGMTQLRYSSSLGWEWEDFDFGSDTPPMDGVGGGRGVTKRRGRFKQKSMLSFRHPNSFPNNCSYLKKHQTLRLVKPWLWKLGVFSPLQFRVFIFFYLIYVLIPLCIHKNSQILPRFFYILGFKIIFMLKEFFK